MLADLALLLAQPCLVGLDDPWPPAPQPPEVCALCPGAVEGGGSHAGSSGAAVRLRAQVDEPGECVGDPCHGQRHCRFTLSARWSVPEGWTWSSTVYGPGFETEAWWPFMHLPDAESTHGSFAPCGSWRRWEMRVDPPEGAEGETAAVVELELKCAECDIAPPSWLELWTLGAGW